jgi:hypothetical protein
VLTYRVAGDGAGDADPLEPGRHRHPSSGCDESFNRLDRTAGRRTTAALGVERVLQDHDGGLLVDNGFHPTASHTGLLQAPVRCRRGQTFIEQSDWNRGKNSRENPDKFSDICRRTSLISPESGRETHHDLHRLTFCDDLRDALKIALSTPNRLNRSREQTAGIACGHTDSDRAHVQPDPYSGPHDDLSPAGQPLRLNP